MVDRENWNNFRDMGDCEIHKLFDTDYIMMKLNPNFLQVAFRQIGLLFFTMLPLANSETIF